VFTLILSNIIETIKITVSTENNIRKAIKDLALAEAHAAQAQQSYYRARKRLESLYSPTARKRGGLTDEQIAAVLLKRNMRIKKPIA
jgi:hypothetical protein